MKLRTWLVIFVGVGLLAVVVGLFFLLFEKREYVVDRGYQGEARYNPLFAAKELLQRLDMDVQSFRALSASQGLPSTEGTLILSTSRLTFNAKRYEGLLDWVRRGGNLIALVSMEEVDGETRQDPLLEALSLDITTGGGDTLLETGLPGESDAYRIYFDTVLRLADLHQNRPNIFKVEDDFGLVAIMQPLEGGYLTLLADASFMTNDYLADHDHGAFLYRMVQWDGPRDEIWLVYGESFDSFFAILVHHAWPFLLSLLILVLFWLWQRAPRVGPLWPDPSPVRRSLMEHIEASGRFIWKLRQAPVLLWVTRAAVRHQLKTRHPGWLQIPDEQMYEKIHEVTGLTLERVRTALEEEDDTSPVQDRVLFANKMALLGELRRSL